MLLIFICVNFFSVGITARCFFLNVFLKKNFKSVDWQMDRTAWPSRAQNRFTLDDTQCFFALPRPYRRRASPGFLTESPPPCAQPHTSSLQVEVRTQGSTSAQPGMLSQDRAQQEATSLPFWVREAQPRSVPSLVSCIEFVSWWLFICPTNWTFSCISHLNWRKKNNNNNKTEGTRVL